MLERFFGFVLFVIVLGVLFFRCGPRPIEPCEFASLDQVQEVEREIERRGETAGFVEGLLFVEDGQGGAAAALLPGSKAVSLNDAGAVSEIFNKYHCPGNDRGLTGGELASAVASPTWQRVVNAVDLVELHPDTTVAEAMTELRGAFDARPVQTLGTANHYSAMPGVEPEVGIGPLQEAGITLATGREGPISQRIAVIDVGFHGHVDMVKGAGLTERRYETTDGLSYRRPDASALARLWNIRRGPVEQIDDYGQGGSEDCQVAHGEFVASVVRQLDRSAAIVAVSAPPVRLEKPNGKLANCWETSEVGVAIALSRLEAVDDETFDAVNMSLGTYPHKPDPTRADDDGCRDTSEVETAPPALDAIFEGNVTWSRSFYASAGNTPAWFDDDDQLVPVRPAAYSKVVGVGALAESQAWVVWSVDAECDLAETASTANAPAPPPGEPLPVWGDVPERMHDPQGMVTYGWVQLLAPGCNLVGLGTEDPDELVIWSGSSFASPIAATLRSLQPQSDGRFATYGYDEIPDEIVGLDFVRGTDREHCGFEQRAPVTGTSQ